MANDFSGDPHCVALWKFDNDATDSKGGNDLTPVDSPTYDSSVKKEGTHSADLPSGPYFTIADADLDANFPGKNGTSEQSFSICCWYRKNSNKAGLFVSKLGVSGKWSYRIWQSSSSVIRFQIGYNNGESVTSLYFGTVTVADIWYHIAAVYNASDNSMKIRVWDDNAGALLDSNATETAGGDMTPADAPILIGGDGGDYNIDGYLDEVVIFKDVLTDDEIDDIRAGTYTYVGTTVTPTTLNLTLTTYAPLILIPTIITPTTLSLTLTGYAPDINIGASVTPATLNLVLTTYAPNVIYDQVVTPPTLNLVFTTYAPILKEAITPSTLSLSLTAYAPSVIIGTLITPTTLSLILTTYIPLIHIRGRRIVVRVITSKYRDVNAITTLNKQVQAITTKGG